MNIKEFNGRCCEILKDIREEDGLYNYYQSRVNNKKMLCHDDELLIKYFMENVDKKCKILEIAAGVGQVSHYLNLNGFENVTINECDRKRFILAQKLNKQLNNNCNLIRNKYQSIDLRHYDYIFTLNGVSSHLGNFDDIPILENLLNKGKKIILKEGYFGVTNDTSFTDKLKEKFKYEVLFETNKEIITPAGMMALPSAPNNNIPMSAEFLVAALSGALNSVLKSEPNMNSNDALRIGLGLGLGIGLRQGQQTGGGFTTTQQTVALQQAMGGGGAGGSSGASHAKGIIMFYVI